MSFHVPGNRWLQVNLSTPAFIYDEAEIRKSVARICRLGAVAGCKVLFAVKSFAIGDAIARMVPPMDGLSVSSLFEAQLARRVLRSCGIVHISAPAYCSDEIEAIAELCDYVSLNSLSQWHRFRTRLTRRSSCGIRVNPQLSLVHDPRYDPCRKYSKLGVPIEDLSSLTRSGALHLDGIEGVHFHNNCDSSDFSGLLATVRHLAVHVSNVLQKVKWVNVGGGYLFDDDQTPDCFCDAVQLLRSKYGVQVFIEPGAAVIRNAGYLASTVLDIFESERKMVAVVDTTVNHMPEVFEYQFVPDVVGHRQDGSYRYIVAGCTCLAGDVFGEYAFDEPLEVGSRLIFTDMGAYTLVKAHMFNGVNLPTIYALTQAGDLVIRKRFTYDDFASRCGVDTHAIV